MAGLPIRHKGTGKYYSFGVDGKELVDQYYLELDDIGGGVEPYYFTILREMRKAPEWVIEKTHDVFGSSEMSSFWGDMARRRGEQESRAMQLMQTLNGMLKDLFKVMREASIIDERVKMYKGFDAGSQADDSALKDIWVTLVEGGAKNPSSVIGLASQVGFVSLPDYFYLTQVKDRGKVDEVVGKYDISEKLAYTLKRKLEQFLLWKERTFKELLTRQKFVNGMLKTLISEIRMYVQWVKPYLKAINKLKNAEFNKPDLVTSFETSFLEITLDAVNSKFKDPFPLVRVKFEQTTSPGEAYQRNYQKGFVHRGRVGITFEGWVYTREHYDEERRKEDEDLIDFLARNVDESIASMKEDLVNFMNPDYYERLLKGEPAEELAKKKAEEERVKKEREERKFKGKFRRARSSFREVFPFINIFLPEKERGEGPSFISHFNPQARYKKRMDLEGARGTLDYPVGVEREEDTKPLYALYLSFRAVYSLLRPPAV